MHKDTKSFKQNLKREVNTSKVISKSFQKEIANMYKKVVDGAQKIGQNIDEER